VDVVTQKQLLFDRLPLVDLAVLQADLVASEVASEGASMVEEVVEASEVVFKIVVGMVVAEVVSDTKEAVDFPGVEVIVVGMEDPTAMAHPPMLQLVQVVVEAAAEVVMVALALQIAMVPAILPHLVGMIRVVAVAHMKTGTAAIVAAAEAMVIAILLEAAAAAIWSR
jgi:hypothetical protein